jgi:hypothetical protein
MGLETIQPADAALARLEEFHCIRGNNVKELGRPTVRYEINPAIFARSAAATESKPITFSVNVTIPQTKRCLLTDVNRFIRAGDPSPYRSLSEVSERLQPFIGVPDFPVVDMEAFDAETEAMKNLFSTVSESVQEALDRRQDEEIEAAKARNALRLEQSYRQDEFEATLRAENDRKTARLYEEKSQSREQSNIEKFRAALVAATSKAKPKSEAQRRAAILRGC